MIENGRHMKTNILYYGDNLDILRKYIPDESVDLIYLDPPFNSKKDYNILFKETSGLESEAQIHAFTDSWHWTQSAQDTYQELITKAPMKVGKLIDSLHSAIGQNDVMAYLVMMTIRLLELHRVLKPIGSLYLHCDPSASHYLKIVLDQIFGPGNFRNEIVWKRTTTHSDAKRYARVTDSILFYSKSSDFIWNKPRSEYDEKYIDIHYCHVDEKGKRFTFDNLVKPQGSVGYYYELLGCPPPPNGWRMPETRARQWIAEGKIAIPPTGKTPRYKRYFDDMEGAAVGNLWNDIPPINSQALERLGYDTQKPLALLERIILASSNEGDIVLDPFCGCGTAVVAAQKLNRKWVGIDVTHLAINLMRTRLKDSFGINVEVIGEPVDLESAKALAHQDRYQFQWWALSKIYARAVGDQKKGADKGIDGVISFIDSADNAAKRIIIQVKSGHVGATTIRELKDVSSKEAMGVLLTLEPPTAPMLKEALDAGYYHSPIWNKDYNRIQIITIEELLNGKTVDMPPQTQTNVTFTKAPKVKKREGEQLFL
jgi:site-specific DNA-methyltransferase (adenine-specific)